MNDRRPLGVQWLTVPACPAFRLSSVPSETVFTSEPALRSRRAFLRQARIDLGLVPHAGWLLFVRGLQAQHRQTRLRWAWLVLPGFVAAGVWAYLETNHLLGIGNTDIPYAAYVLGGTVIWQLFFESLNVPLQKLGGARASLTKSRLPHESYVAGGLFEIAFNFVVRLVPFFVVLALTGGDFRWTIALVPLGAIALITFGLALGMLAAPAGLLYQDVGKVIAVVAGFWFFLTPVVYPQPADGTGALLIRLNPVRPLLDTTRAWAGGSQGADAIAVAAIFAVSCVVLIAAWITYRLAQPHLIARL